MQSTHMIDCIFPIFSCISQRDDSYIECRTGRFLIVDSLENSALFVTKGMEIVWKEA